MTTSETSTSLVVAAQPFTSPVGAVVISSGQLAEENQWKFSTKIWDAESGLGYWGYRYLDAETGRWLSRDPMEEKAGLNLYVYLHNAPISGVDLLGLDAIQSCRGVDLKSVKFGTKAALGKMLSSEISVRGVVDWRACTSYCCEKDEDISDDYLSIGIEGNVIISGSPVRGSLTARDFGVKADFGGGYWAGVQVAATGTGSASGKIQSDRCHNRELDGSVCLSVGGNFSASGGANMWLQLGRVLLEFGAYVTGSGGYTLGKCYSCKAGVCGWDKGTFCFTDKLTLNFNVLLLGSSSIVLHEGKACLDVE